MNTKYNGDILSHNARVVKAGGVVESLDYTNFISEESKQIRSDFFRIYNNPAFCYSLRRLNTAYKGPAIRVRRSSDNAQADINYTLDHELDIETLLSFVGSGNSGFVSTWYDQSGNGRHISNSTTTAQPVIVNSGALVTVNSKPAIDFDGVDDILYRDSVPGVSFSQNFSFFIAHKTKAMATSNRFVFMTTIDTNNRFALSYYTTTTLGINVMISGVSYQKNYGVSANTNYLAYVEASPLNLFVNNNPSTGILATNGFSTANISIGGNRNLTSTTFASFYIQEVMMFQHKSAIEQTAIQNNINSYYNIY